MPPVDDYRGNDRFEIIRRIGAGGMGVVYDAFDRERGMRVALKTLPQIHPQALYLFKNEFRSLAGVSHPNLVTLYELLNEGERWFFTMEFVEGVDFLHFVAPNSALEAGSAATMTLAAEVAPASPRHRFSPTVDYAALRDALAQVVTGLAALHAQEKVHRDVKPSNVLVTGQGRVVILDFGLVQDVSADPLSTTSGAGSAAYMSPEQAAGQPLHPATDWYSTGVMLHEVLTGELPRRGGPLSLEMLAPAAPPDLKNLCAALLQVDRTKRPGGREILAMLDQSPKAVQEPAEKLFVGRARELATLDQAFRRMRRGEAVVVSIEGASGLGKSALLRESAERFRDENATVLEGRCYEQESVPYKAIDNLIDRLTSYLGRLPEIEIAGLLPRDAGLLPDLFPVMAGLPEIAAAHVRGTIEPQEIRRRAFQAIRELFSRLGDRVPLVLIIDDLQWGDQDSANLLAEVLRQPDGPALLLIVAYRAGYAGRSPALDALLAALGTQKASRFHIELSPLEVEETQELVNLLLPGGRAANSSLIETIVRETQGNAFFIRELVHTAREEGIQRSVNLESAILGRVSHGLDAPHAQRLA